MPSLNIHSVLRLLSLLLFLVMALGHILGLIDRGVKSQVLSLTTARFSLLREELIMTGINHFIARVKWIVVANLVLFYVVTLVAYRLGFFFKWCSQISAVLTVIGSFVCFPARMEKTYRIFMMGCSSLLGLGCSWTLTLAFGRFLVVYHGQAIIVFSVIIWNLVWHLLIEPLTEIDARHILLLKVTYFIGWALWIVLIFPCCIFLVSLSTVLFGLASWSTVLLHGTTRLEFYVWPGVNDFFCGY